ncbi:MAG TPA: hypothetical protein VLV78_23055 [Thermoanaerobaculia bacterium]|nr:hypothetical protein [Thermoanaerobaculia bacterium]
MPRVADFRIASCQATLFTPDAEVSTSNFLSRLLPRWLNRFDGEPAILPIPEGLPKDVPRVILQSRSTNWRCEIASARVNIFWRAAAEGNERLEPIFAELTPLLIEYFEFIDSRVGRLAAVINRYVRHPAPARFLASHFCKERWMAAPFNRPESFELHAHKVFPLAGRFQTNSWVRNKTATVTMGAEERPAVLVEQDLNTLVEETATRAFSPDEIAGFFQAVARGFDETLTLYYPDDLAEQEDRTLHAERAG